MMTHASTTLPWRRSFSVHVEMYSRGSNSRGRRSSFTTCWSRMARRRTSRPGKTFAGSAPVAYRRQAHDRAERHEDDREQPEAERAVPCNHDPRGVREGSGQVHQELVHHEQENAEPHEADPAPWASVAMRDRGRRVCGRVGDRFRNLRRLGGRDRDGLGLGEICGRVPSDRKSTRLNSSHVAISYAVFCLKKKKPTDVNTVTTSACFGLIPSVRTLHRRHKS